MQYIQLISFIDLCSIAFLHVLDESVKNFDGNGNISININRKITGMFSYYLSEEYNKNTKNGTKTLFYNTCRPALNWRKMSVILPPKYFITDETVLVNPNKLESLIDYQWNFLCKEKRYQTINMNVMDSIDIKNCATKYIGQSFITQTEQSFKIICDGNKIYHDSLLLEIPNYLNNEMKIQLRAYGIT